MKFNSHRCKKEHSKRSVARLSDLVPGKVYMIDSEVQYHSVPMIPSSRVYLAPEFPDPIGEIPYVWVSKKSLLFFVEAKECFSFDSFPIVSMHYKFLFGEKEVWVESGCNFELKFLLQDVG